MILSGVMWTWNGCLGSSRLERPIGAPAAAVRPNARCKRPGLRGGSAGSAYRGPGSHLSNIALGYAQHFERLTKDRILGEWAVQILGHTEQRRRPS